MSSYGYTHIGYYLIGKVRTVPSKEMVDVCSKDATHDHDGSGAFCPECGSKIVSVPSTEMEEVRFGDIPQEAFEGTMYDELYMPDYVSPEGFTIVASNYNAGCISLDDNTSGIISEEDLDKEAMYNKFMDKHAEHVSIIAEHVLDDVQIKFGIFRYYM